MKKKTKKNNNTYHHTLYHMFIPHLTVQILNEFPLMEAAF